MKDDEVKKAVREGYAKVAKGSGSCCAPARESSCCGGVPTANDVSRRLGYSDEEMAAAPEGANLGLGCGNPTALATLRPGEVVLDLGSGAGFDCFLAAKQVGETGRVIGVDMTPEMIEKARVNAEKAGVKNVQFRLGEIEHLPVSNGSVDCTISNCVINLVPDKGQVFREVFRTLKPGGRMMVSDIVLRKELQAKVRDSITAYVGCLSGAVLRQEYLDLIRAAGFEDVRVLTETGMAFETLAADPTARAVASELGLDAAGAADVLSAIASVSVAATKPLAR